MNTDLTASNNKETSSDANPSNDAPGDNASLRISVVIPALNEEELIEHSIQSARNAGAWQIIVSDGGSKDSTVEKATGLGCEIVIPMPGRGTQLAAGAAIATGDVLLFLHADIILASDCLNQIRDCLNVPPPNEPTAPAWVWGCFEHRIDAEGRRFRWLERGNRWRAKVRKVVYGDQVLWVRRDTYQQVGGFPAVPLMEDVMLSDSLGKVSAPVVLPGPVTINARRWKNKGVVWTTARNWFLFGLFRCGVSPKRLARMYR